MVCGRRSDYCIPDDGLVRQLGSVFGVLVGPAGGYVDEDLFGVPGEEGGEVGGEGEADVGTVFQFAGVVVGATS
jgi:hypothetical protein